MNPVALFALSAQAASVDRAHPATLPPEVAQHLVDLSAIESATMTVWFDGPFALRILGGPSFEPLLAYAAKRSPWAENNKSMQVTAAAGLAASVRFEVKVLHDARKGVVVSVPAVHWGELEAFGPRPDDHAVCETVEKLLGSLLIWSDVHLGGGSPALDESILAVEVPRRFATHNALASAGMEQHRETSVPISLGNGDRLAGLHYVKSGESYLLGHIDAHEGGKLVGQLDVAFADVDGVPWPRDIRWHAAEYVLEMHFGDVQLKDDVAPFLPAERPWTAPPVVRRVAPPIDPTAPSGWQDALDAIDEHFYSLASAEALHFTVARTSDFATLLSPDFVGKYRKKNRLTMTPLQIDAELVRLSQQITYDVDVVLSPFSLRVRAVHLGELDAAFTAKEIEALRQRTETEISSTVFGAPNHMMLQPGGFFPSTDVVKNVEREPRGTLVTTATPQETRTILLDDETGLPLELRGPDGARYTYEFAPSPTGTMLVTKVAIFAPNGRLVTTTTYAYGDVGGVTAPTSVKTIVSTFTLTDWRVVDTTAPFLERRP